MCCYLLRTCIRTTLPISPKTGVRWQIGINTWPCRPCVPLFCYSTYTRGHTRPSGVLILRINKLPGRATARGLRFKRKLQDRRMKERKKEGRKKEETHRDTESLFSRRVRRPTHSGRVFSFVTLCKRTSSGEELKFMIKCLFIDIHLRRG